VEGSIARLDRLLFQGRGWQVLEPYRRRVWSASGPTRASRNVSYYVGCSGLSRLVMLSAIFSAFDPERKLLDFTADSLPLNAGNVLERHWPSTAIITLRAAACRLAISGR
jgi:hypothetical protein